MAEPSGSLLPVSYDSALSLLGDLIDHRNLTLAQDVDDEQTTLGLQGYAGDIALPVYLRFGDGSDEIVYVEVIDGVSMSGVVRGAAGTVAGAHSAGAPLYLAYTGRHLAQMRDALLAAQRYQGVVGPLAGRPASPRVSEVYITDDEGQEPRIYAAIGEDLASGQWQEIGRPNHADLDDLEEDSHSTLHTDERAEEWHDGLPGGHVVGGDNHDHSVGIGVARLAGGDVASRPEEPVEREVWYAGDEKILYVSPDGESWAAITGAPAGAIAMFSEDAVAVYGGDCPPGWERFTALDERMPIGAPEGVTEGLGNVGSDSHTHDYSAVAQHLHTVAAFTGSTTTSGAHSHSIKRYSASAGQGYHDASVSGGGTVWLSSAGAHSHSFSKAATVTGGAKRTSDGAAGVASAVTDAGSTVPVYHTIIFCERV